MWYNLLIHKQTWSAKQEIKKEVIIAKKKKKIFLTYGRDSGKYLNSVSDLISEQWQTSVTLHSTGLQNLSHATRCSTVLYPGHPIWS